MATRLSAAVDDGVDGAAGETLVPIVVPQAATVTTTMSANRRCRMTSTTGCETCARMLDGAPCPNGYGHSRHNLAAR
jgi:hypothetical protein